jgi:ABC-type sugar transport system permease subunit
VGKDRLGLFFVLPNLIIYGVFIFVPLVWTVVLSFTDYNLFQFEWTGLRNYARMLSDTIFLRSIWNTLRFAVGTIIPSMVMGLVIASLLNGAIKGKGVFRTIIFLPNIISVVAGALAWTFILNSSSYGIANQILIRLGLEPKSWLLDVQLAMPSVIIMSIWARIGFNMLVYLAGLQGIPGMLYEAATIDGASRVRQFFSIMIPLLRPTTFFLLVMSTIQSFQVFGQVYIMTSGGPLNTTTTIVHQIYQNGFQAYRMGYASSQAVFLLLLVLVVTLFNFKTGNRGEVSDVS